MLDLKELLKNKKKYIELISRKGYYLEKEIDFLEKKYLIYYKNLQDEEKTRQKLNLISNEIKKIFSNEKLLENDKKEKTANLKEKASKLSEKASKLSKKKKKIYEEIESKLAYFPNVPFDDVVIGKDENDNKIILEKLSELKIDKKNFKNHWEIIEEKNLISSNEAKNISGSRHIIFNEKLSKLIKALETLMLKINEKHGYKILEVPVIVNKESLYNTAQLPKFEEDLYKLSNDQYLIPTAEVPLTNYFSNKIFKYIDLPQKLTSSTNCFRREAGSAGKDTRGIIRLHQFRKVELVKIGNPKNYKEDFSEMVSIPSKILEILKIPHRIVELCTGDMSFASKRTYDIEIWFPGSQQYREVSSISTIGDFQSRRMKARFIDEDDNKNFVFTYNGSSLAIERTLASIIENYFDESKNIIKVPEVLKKYLDFEEI